MLSLCTFSEDTLGTPHVSQQSVNIPVLSEEGSQTPGKASLNDVNI